MVDPQQINLYTYVRNNLSKFVDITGKDLILANANAGDTFRQVSTKGLTKAERQNIRIDRNGKVTLINPKAINLQKASTTYQDLAGVINDKNITVKVYSVAQGQTVNVNGQSVSYQDAYDNGELTFGKPGDAVREVVITVGGAAPILGNPPGSGNKVSFPEDAIFAHEVFGHASGNDGDASVDAENRYRNNSNPVLPEQSGEDHKHTTTVTATPDLLQTEHNQVNTTIPLIPAKPLPPPPKPLPTPQYEAVTLRGEIIIMLKQLFTILTICAYLVCCGQLFAQEKSDTEKDCKCDFSNYKPLIVSHALSAAIIKEVEPEYPATARAAKAQSEVEVIIIADRQGNVVDACVAKGHPLLASAAKKAALQWKFKKNFGFTERQKKKYIQASLFFNFAQK